MQFRDIYRRHLERPNEITGHQNGSHVRSAKRAPDSDGRNQSWKTVRLEMPLVAVLATTTAGAQSADWLETAQAVHPYAAVSVTSDSNLLRNPNGLGDKADRYVTLEAGLDTEIHVSRQRFLIDGRILRNDYDRFSGLDHTAGDADLLWKWTVGRLWEGDLGYTYERQMRDLANELIPERDMLDRHKLYGALNRWLTPRWRLGAQLDWMKVSFSTSTFLDKTVSGSGLSIDYVSRAENVVGFETTYASTQFDSSGERDFNDFALGPTFDWQLTGKTRLKGAAGYKARRHDQLSDRDFDGFVGKLSAIWKATGKTSVKATISRDLSSLDDEIADYAIVDGIRIEPTWDVRSKTRIRALAGYERRDFQGAQLDLIDPGVANREDRVSTLELGVDWRPLRNVSLDLSVGAESRDSNRTLRKYDYQYVQLGFSVGL